MEEGASHEAGGCGYRETEAGGGQRQPAPQQPLPAAVQELESLLRRRDNLQAMLRQERNRQESLRQQPGASPAIEESLVHVDKALADALQAVDDAIEALVQQHPQLARQRRHLCSVSGIGMRNVLAILVLLYRWEAYTGGTGSAKGLTADVGLDPVTCQSGTRGHKRARFSEWATTPCASASFSAPWAVPTPVPLL
jgi:transposase